MKTILFALFCFFVLVIVALALYHTIKRYKIKKRCYILMHEIEVAYSSTSGDARSIYKCEELFDLAEKIGIYLQKPRKEYFFERASEAQNKYIENFKLQRVPIVAIASRTQDKSEVDRHANALEHEIHQLEVELSRFTNKFQDLAKKKAS